MSHSEPSLDLHRLELRGMDLSETEADLLEDTIKQNPDDLNSRILLLGFQRRRRFHNVQLIPKFIENIAWLVDHKPDLQIMRSVGNVLQDIDGASAYVNIKNRWIEQVNKHSENVEILENAASFFILADRALSERCLHHAKRLQPTNHRWSEELVHLYSLFGSYYEQQALIEGERALLLTTKPVERFYALTRMPSVAFRADQIDKAQAFAKALLKTAKSFRTDWNYGNAVNAAHTTLGRIALRSGDRKKAGLHLLKSAKDADSPQTSSFGPDQILAAEMIDAGEKKQVLEYWNLCEAFWESGRTQLKNWRVELEADRNPIRSKPTDWAEFVDLALKPRLLYDNFRLVEARRASLRLLSLAGGQQDDNRFYGFALHTAHVVLGQLALLDGNIDVAKKHLEEAGNVPQGNQFLSRGVDMELARQLARHGEKNVVLAFFNKFDSSCNAVEEVDFEEWFSRAASGEVAPKLFSFDDHPRE